MSFAAIPLVSALKLYELSATHCHTLFNFRNRGKLLRKGTTNIVVAPASFVSNLAKLLYQVFFLRLQPGDFSLNL